MTAVELRDALGAATGLSLPSTIAFDHPTVAALAQYLGEVLGAESGSVEAAPARVGADEPIAIVAMACRFPGGVRSADDLWALVAEGRDAIGPFPTDRGWDLDGLYHPDPDHPGTTYAREGGFVDGVDRFDADLFGINPREALAMDPQQRLLLETSWEVFERAGMDPQRLAGAPAGVFVGAATQGYGTGLAEFPEGVEGYLLTGNASSVVSGRLAYTYGLRGPALTVDTACSSALVAVHLAGQALNRGECALALAGGVMVMPTPLAFVEFSRQRGLAPDGRCKPFAEAADGTGWSEGAGMVLLERLSDARRNGHPVLAVIRASAVNQDGASNGLTAPSGLAQQRVIRQALAGAALSAADVDAVEAHGTGTALGDPIEAGALLATYGRDRAEDRPLWLGSVKSNIGHTQAAAGIAGLIKMVQAMRHGTLPPTLHVDRPTSHVDWSSGAVRLLTEAVPWPAGERPRRAGVSAFGASGTNAHVILESVEPAEPAEPAPARDRGPVLPFVLSAKTRDALRDQAERLRKHLEADPALALDDAAYSLVETRAQLPSRAVFAARDRGRVLAALGDLARDEPDPGVVTGTATGDGGRVVFVFPGQGAQWPGMARELTEQSPVFAGRLAECAAALAPHLDWSIMDVLRGVPEAPSLTRTDVVQPVLFAVMLSLAELWQAHGVRPDAVVGHSQGEIAAACLAGAIPLPVAARMVALRGKALTGLSGAGAMGSVLMPYDALAERLPGWGGRVEVAAVNGPTSVIVSGDADAVADLLDRLAAEGVRTRRIQADGAGHSAHVDPLRPRMEEAFAGVEPAATPLAFYSTVTGERMGTEELDPGYWHRNVRQTVHFEKATRALLDAGHTTFVELSPHPVLALALQGTATAAGRDVVALGSLRRDEGGLDRFFTSLGEAYAHGVPVDWSAAVAGRRVPLPTYAFQGRRFWLARGTADAGDVTAAGVAEAGHPLLGAVVALAEGGGVVLTGRLSLRAQPWLADHTVGGTPLVPGTALLELALRAGDQVGCDRVDELTLSAPLVLPAAGAMRVQVTVDAERRVSVHARPEDAGDAQPWTLHATGVLGAGGPEAGFDMSAWPPPDAEPVPVDGLYDRFAAGGYGYGPAFRGLTAAWRRGDETFAEVRLPAEQRSEAGRFGLHPALLDAALHAIAAGRTEPGAVRVPFAWNGVALHASGAAALRVRLSPAGDGGIAVAVADESGAPVASVAELTTRELTPQALRAAAGPRQDMLYRVTWSPLPAPAGPAPLPRWAVAGEDDLGAGPALAAAGDGTAGPDEKPELVVASLAAGQTALGVAPVTGSGGTTVGGRTPTARAVHGAVQRALRLVRSWIAEGPPDAVLAILTRGAVHTGGAAVSDLAYAPVWGLVRSAQTENPGRFLLVDVDDASWEALPGVLAGAIAAGEPQVAVRDGRAYGCRLVPLTEDGTVLTPPAGAPGWRLEVKDGGGAVDDLVLAPAPAATAPLLPGQVRVAVQAAGLNFRDVLITLGLYPVPSALGGEGAGVVLEAGEGVTGLRPGDRVMGLFAECGALGPVAVTDHRVLAPIPAGLSFVDAATIPVTFLTAWHGLVHLARLRPGETVLVHAAAGGVGMAAVQIADHLGATVYGTASPAKWPATGLPADRLASSRTLEFADKFASSTVDVVLNALAGEFVDASLGLLREGGRFLEMGKTDLRDPEAVAAAHPGVTYRAYDLNEAGPDQLGAMLRELVALFEVGALRPLPVTRWDVRRAPAAFRHLSQAKHVGKVVLTPRVFDPDGTVLVTGATGTLGRLAARHLVSAHGVRRLLLASRRGAAPDLVDELRGLGAEVTAVACDVADREALAATLAGVPAAHPLRAVVHTAGVLDDGLAASLTPEQVDRVLRPKVDAALHLHELTRHLDLRAFVLYSAASGVLGGPGQANYAAANTFLDALARHRHAHGLPACSIAWGLWAPASGMAELTGADIARMARGGVQPLAAEQGMALFDAAFAGAEPVPVPVRFDLPALRAQGPALPPLLRALAGPGARRTARSGPVTRDGGAALRRKLAGLPAPEREKELVTLVRAQAAAALGHGDPAAVPATAAFLELGFDSLTAVELRNRLGAATGLRLPPTLVFDRPTPAALAGYLVAELPVTESAAPAPAPPAAGAGLPALFAEAVASGRTPEFMAALRGMSDFRPTYTSTVVDPAWLTRGPALPRLICLPSIVGKSGPHQYARFAAALRGERDVVALPHPGFRTGEPVPRDVEAAIAAHAGAVRQLAGDEPFALAGYSSGGLVAHAVAAELERRGAPASALVLLDSYPPEATDALDALLPLVLGGLLARQERLTAQGPGADSWGEAWLTAMARWIHFDWSLRELAAPVLLARATAPMPGSAQAAGLRARWPGAAVLDVEGDHFTLMESHAGATARAVHDWLGERLAGATDNGGGNP
ncbi:phenolphthiocerol synthesis polyketide synthase type I Pks15/1 [Phytohabitans suffuscus]|uniref:Phenolphthiocerol synthesis polyketide synthase type I Pks15/1 n=1 Tax=Phytohabitans suffuscus TaxID=624315 RepID=A0A6F8YTW2_9ACTN|nr:phenolphthiocerol synthesis polyketide synthase type I Pks15/1 [Phytohabitans suffuscus]